MIEIRNLCFSYDRQHPVLKNLNFATSEGQLVTVLGPNGVGKSTLFKCILGFYRDYQGEILYSGRECRELSRKEMAREVAYIPQSADPAFNYTVFDTVLMGTTSALNVVRAPGKKQRAAVEEALKVLHIEHLKFRGVSQISGGERQLVLIARAMVQNAKLLIMDEPTANLDFGNQYLVLDTIRELTQQGYSILMSTHNPDHALRFSTHVLALKRNCEYVTGPADEILNEDLVSEIYGIPVKISAVETTEGKIRNCVPLLRV